MLAKRRAISNNKLKVGEYYFVERWAIRENGCYVGTKKITTIGKMLKAYKKKISTRWHARGYKFEWEIEFQELTKEGSLNTINKKESYSTFYPFTFKRALELLPKYKPKDKAQRAFLREALKGIASEITS